jgi:NAD(P)-dependent dehydrogenase (short-subunit alcohol dehydrogenase family)
MALFSSMLTQFWPPPPSFTEKDVPSQEGRVFIVTGGNQGVGLELIKMLYPTGAVIYMASRSKERAEHSIKEVVSTDPSGSARLKFLHLDLDDLNAVRSAARTFSERESRLDIIWNNAGIGGVKVGSKTKQGIEAHIGVNVIAPFLFTQLLLPKLQAAAAASPNHSVRIIWTGSFMMEGRSPKGGYSLKDIEKGGTNDPYVNYAMSKAANWILADEYGKRYGKDGIISVVQNPGNLKTEIYNGQPKLMMFFVNGLLYPPKMGGYTELYAGLSPEITAKDQGGIIIPWGRVQARNPRKDICEALERGKGKELWDWIEAQIKAHT